MDKKELNKRLEIEGELMGMKISILTKYHLNELGKKKKLRDIDYSDFRGCLFSQKDADNSSLVIYVSEGGIRCLKRRYANEDIEMYMNHLGFADWEY
tara:strand:+ start:486 stop:776 length:291 start_codon:yes stop_codon:yes gene_type:complete